MRCPWVSRLALDMIERENDRLRTDLVAERVRSADILSVVLRMKENGAVLLPEHSRVLLPPRQPTAIEKLIDDDPRARTDPRLRAQLFAFAENQLKKGVAEQDVLETLANWSDPTHADDADDEAFP